MEAWLNHGESCVFTTHDLESGVQRRRVVRGSARKGAQPSPSSLLALSIAVTRSDRSPLSLHLGQHQSSSIPRTGQGFVTNRPSISRTAHAWRVGLAGRPVAMRPTYTGWKSRRCLGATPLPSSQAGPDGGDSRIAPAKLSLSGTWRCLRSPFASILRCSVRCADGPTRKE